MKAIIVVEDKAEELEKAIAAIKERLAVGLAPALVKNRELVGEESLRYQTEDPDTFGFEHLGSVAIFLAATAMSAAGALKLAKDEQRKGRIEELFILTDLMFPSVKNGQEQANGISIIIDAVESGIPVVVCSDTDHHQVQFLPKMCNHIRERNQGAEVNLVLDQKDWKKAVELLLPTD
jgi:hypothetical protein